MGSPLRLLLCLVAATQALNPKNKPQTQACVDEQGNAIECVQPDDGPGSLQDQFVEKVATARRLKGLEGEPAQPSMTQRKNAERKARQAMRRKRSGVCPEDGLCHYEETRFVPPECAPGDRSCADDNRRLEEAQGALREDLQRQLDAEYTRLDAEAASTPIDNDTAPPPRYYGDAELAAALDRELEAQIEQVKTLESLRATQLAQIAASKAESEIAANAATLNAWFLRFFCWSMKSLRASSFRPVLSMHLP